MTVLIWGSYDLGKPRTRLMREAIRLSGADVRELHASVWEGAEDKAVLTRSSAFRRGLKLVLSYPGLVWRFMTGPRPDVVVVGYLGHLDVLVLWLFAKVRGVPVVWDAFLSLHDTVVADRHMLSPGHPLAKAIWTWEWLACRAASRVVLDTEAQAALFRRAYRLRPEHATSVFVGAEAGSFPEAPPARATDQAEVLFYGQFIPLHGIATIVEAARLARDRPIHWTIIGRGQESERIRAMLATDAPERLTWVDWVPYETLAQRIAAADICLGVFGDSEKAGRVIPNKVFQILSAGRPLVTRDGPGMRELVAEGASGVELVPPGDPVALLAAVERLLAAGPYPEGLHRNIVARFSIEALADSWRRILDEERNA